MTKPNTEPRTIGEGWEYLTAQEKEDLLHYLDYSPRLDKRRNLVMAMLPFVTIKDALTVYGPSTHGLTLFRKQIWWKLNAINNGDTMWLKALSRDDR